jgi:hypothetical protein
VNKRKVILGLSLGIGITPGFCDFNDLYTKYPLLAITQGNEKISAVRKAVCYEEFLADKFVNFFNVQNALDFLSRKLDDIGERLGSVNFPHLGVVPNFAQIVSDMRLFSGDRVANLMESISTYKAEEIIQAMNTVIGLLQDFDTEKLEEDEEIGPFDPNIQEWADAAIAELQGIAENIADPAYLDSLYPCAEEILDILEVPPPQSLYDTLVALQESNCYMDNFIATTTQRVKNLEKRVNFLLRATRSF